MRSKRGAGNVFWIIMEIVIAIAILLILIYMVTRNSGNFLKGLNSCEAKGGECLSSCGSLEAMPAGDAGCEKEFKNQNMVCCKKAETQQQTGVGANSELIKVLINNEKTSLTYGERRDMDIGTVYKIDTVLDSKKLESLTGTQNMVCSLFLKDTDTSQEYVMERTEKPLSSDEQKKPIPLDDAKESYNQGDSFIVGCNAKDKLWLRYIKPEDLQAGRIYALKIIVYDKDVADNMIKSGSITNDAYSDDFKSLILDETHWAAEFTAYLRVKPIIEIKDISGTWVVFDDITVTANAPYKLSNVSIAIVPGNKTLEELQPKGENVDLDQKSLYQQIYDACISETNGPVYWYRLNKITAIKAGEQGINLGLFTAGRQAYQSAMYESQLQPIEMINGQAKVHIDASSISENFQIGDMKEEKEGPLKEQYLCVKAKVYGPDGKVKIIHSASSQPLRLDVAPPLIDETDTYIQVKYPEYKLLQDSITKLIEQNRITPNQQVTPYYFEQYPKIVIKKCIDKSGCKNYNYYFAPTNIRININTNDLATGIVGTILGYGLNYLYQQIVASNPLETICPLANSGQYRTNSYPEIRFYKDQQGIFCIKAIDAVGNYWLTWKTAYNPYDVIEDVVANATGTTGTTGITPVIGS